MMEDWELDWPLGFIDLTLLGSAGISDGERRTTLNCSEIWYVLIRTPRIEVPDKFASHIMCVKSKLQEVQDHKVEPRMSHKFYFS